MDEATKKRLAEIYDDPGGLMACSPELYSALIAREDVSEARHQGYEAGKEAMKAHVLGILRQAEIKIEELHELHVHRLYPESAKAAMSCLQILQDATRQVEAGE